MQLSRYTDYSLRVLLFASSRGGERVTLLQIADYYAISIEHLRKVVHELARSGYINTFQGKGGGIELAHDPSEIGIGDVVRHFEGHDNVIDCEGLDCRLARVCTLRAILKEAHADFFAALDQYSLSDLIDDKDMLTVLARDG